MPTISPQKLAELTARIFEAAGTPGDLAAVVADHLVEANLKGHDSHGVLRVKQYVDDIDCGHIVPSQTGDVLKNSGATALIHGRRGFGQVVAMQAMGQAIELAKANGIGAVSIYDCAHTGRLGAYVEAAAKADMIGMLFVNASGGGQSVAPFGGLDRRLATNPLAIAAPRGDGKAVVLDIATSTVPEGKVRDHYQKGESLPGDFLMTSEGLPSNDPNDFYEGGGAIQPLGGSLGYKGFGLGFMIDILAGALSGAGCSSSEASEPRDAMLLIAIDINTFGGADQLVDKVQGLIDHVKTSRLRNGSREIYAPGELEFRAEQQRSRDGIEVHEKLWGEISQIAERFQIDVGQLIESEMLGRLP